MGKIGNFAANNSFEYTSGFSHKGRWIIEGCHYVIEETVTHQLGCSRELREIHRAS